jgi:hypothetical protein
MYLYAYCKSNSVIFAPFRKLDTAVDFALQNIEGIIGRNAPVAIPAKKKMRNPAQQVNGGFNGFLPDEADDDAPFPAIIDLGLAPQPVMPRKKGKVPLLPQDNKEELEKLFKQIDHTRADKTLKNAFMTIQMTEDYLRYTKGQGAVLHSLEEVKLPNLKERDAYQDGF